MQQAPAQRHNFADYANTWFDVYAKPSIEKATATTYKRQITRYLIPHFDGISVEEITVDDVQRLFNDISGTKATKDKVKIVLNPMLCDFCVQTPEITAFYHMVGNFNVLLRFAVPDVKTLDALVGRIKTFGDSRTSIEL